jgi:hypothetical protein
MGFMRSCLNYLFGQTIRRPRLGMPRIKWWQTATICEQCKYHDERMRDSRVQSFHRLVDVALPVGSLPRIWCARASRGKYLQLQASTTQTARFHPVGHKSISYACAPRPYMVHSSSAPWRNGFAISSDPSTGESSTRSVPRATINPKDLERSFPSSSGSCQ